MKEIIIKQIYYNENPLYKMIERKREREKSPLQYNGRSTRKVFLVNFKIEESLRNRLQLQHKPGSLQCRGRSPKLTLVQKRSILNRRRSQSQTLVQIKISRVYSRIEEDLRIQLQYRGRIQRQIIQYREKSQMSTQNCQTLVYRNISEVEYSIEENLRGRI